MVLLKFVAFVFFEKSHSLVFMRNFLNDDVGKVSKTGQRDIKFIFDEHSDFFVFFMSNFIFSATENVSFT